MTKQLKHNQTGRKKTKVASLETLQAIRLESGKTLDYYLLERPELFAIALCETIRSLNRFAEPKVTYILNKDTDTRLHIAVLHAGDLVDIRGRHKSMNTILDDITDVAIPESKLGISQHLATTVVKEVKENEDLDSLEDELRTLRVYVKREWLSHSNFYIS